MRSDCTTGDRATRDRRGDLDQAFVSNRRICYPKAAAVTTSIVMISLTFIGVVSSALAASPRTSLIALELSACAASTPKAKVPRRRPGRRRGGLGGSPDDVELAVDRAGLSPARFARSLGQRPLGPSPLEAELRWVYGEPRRTERS